MTTINQVLRGAHKKIKLVSKSAIHPQIKGICEKLFTAKPRKPNSAIRKLVRIKISNGQKLVAYIPGEGHTLQEHHEILIRGGKRKDLPGIKYIAVRGNRNFEGVKNRKSSRSKYGTKKGLHVYKIL